MSSAGFVEPLRRRIFEILTYLILAGLPALSLAFNGGQLTAETNVALLFLLAYTILLVLPVSKFKLTPSGFEADIDRLAKNAPTTAGTVSGSLGVGLEARVTVVEPDLVDPRSNFLQLSIDIERKLRVLAQGHGVTGKIPLGQLIEKLRRMEVITDAWLLDALTVFRKRRNEIVHEGNLRDINAAIEIGKLVIAKLEETQAGGVAQSGS